MTRLWAWLATRAASGWIAAAAIGLLGGAWFAYDLRGDKIAELELELALCTGSAEQSAAIDRLSRELNRQAQDNAQNEVDQINALPNDCYPLDGPSPLNRVRGDQE